MSGIYTTGVVKSIVDGRGFCFLSPPQEGGKDVFCHFSEFKKAGLRDPQKGETYEFEIEMSPKGPQAVNIRAVL
jgi:CspA family cold shock protein